MNPAVNYIKEKVVNIYDLVSGKSIRECDKLANSLEKALDKEEKEAKKFYYALKEIDKLADNYLN